MHRSNRMQPNQNRRHSGFTLIELLVAISIIALLAGLLLSGVGSGISSVNKAKAANELRSLETALASFHSEFGMYPPSAITLHEAPAGWNGDARSKNLIQKLWPSFDFTITRNINSDNSTDVSIDLNGAECLAFFLGGIPQSGALIGFSKNPANPFSRTGNNRTGPFHEFIASRFVDKDSDDIPEYVDTFAGQTSPIVYFSSYDGRGYRSSEITPLLANGIYRQGKETDPTMGQPDDTTPWKEKTFQLISPGQDGLYGTGGYYSPDDTSGLSEEDADNLTNFTTGTLK
ncbi:MAG TPA: hypothetical protein DD473_09275 [Planctomycetaceae bacterium]|nr:hypothetical protein [Planctomycetaceae bacterium]